MGTLQRATYALLLLLLAGCGVAGVGPQVSITSEHSPMAQYTIIPNVPVEIDRDCYCMLMAAVDDDGNVVYIDQYTQLVVYWGIRVNHPLPQHAYVWIAQSRQRHAGGGVTASSGKNFTPGQRISAHTGQLVPGGGVVATTRAGQPLAIGSAHTAHAYAAGGLTSRPTQVVSQPQHSNGGCHKRRC